MALSGGRAAEFLRSLIDRIGPPGTLPRRGSLLGRRSLLVLLVDAVLAAAALAGSFLLRFDFRLPDGSGALFWQGLCLAILVKPPVFLCLGFYRNIWRYASLQDAINIFKAVSISSVVISFLVMFSRYSASFPRSIIVLDWFLLLFLVSASRIAWRCYRTIQCARGNHSVGRRTLIVGAGDAGSLVLREIRRQGVTPYRIVGFVDDDPAKRGMLLGGVPVLGGQEELQALVREFGIEEIVIAIPSVRGKAFRNIVDNCQKAGVRFRILPAMRDILDGTLSVSHIKEVEIDDLLGREPVELDEAAVRHYLHDKRVLVSGAAGSIGSEVCRQVARFKPDKLILVDNAETPLFYIERELAAKYPDLRIIPVIGDVSVKGKIEKIFETYTPDVVFHAAAYKHVPMMEHNPSEAVSNNVAGTKIMADAADRFGVRNFVMISTDKAVNPTNVMGASKRAAEMYVQALARTSRTKFTTVRFGNVLGSNGSVIPLFMEQIRKGGPVTVTDPDVSRYFMTIPEATQLVLQAGCLGKGGEIFVLDMGEPIRILFLAEELIKLSGLVPYEDIDIVFTGLRPGEKLFEELLIDGEGIMPTTHEKIRVAAAVATDRAAMNAELNHLFALSDRYDVAGVIRSLRRLVKEFTPDHAHAAAEPLNFHRLPSDGSSRQKEAPASAKILPMRAKSGSRM